MKTVTHEAVGYSVVLSTGGDRFALHSGGVADRAFFTTYRKAVAFKRELAAHLMVGRVVKVRVVMQTCTPPGEETPR